MNPVYSLSSRKIIHLLFEDNYFFRLNEYSLETNKYLFELSK